LNRNIPGLLKYYTPAAPPQSTDLMKNHFSYITLFFLFLTGCSSDSTAPSDQNSSDSQVTTHTEFYFPPVDGQGWEIQSALGLGWDESSLPALYEFLDNTNRHTASDTWQWNSAGKTLVAATTGIAYEQALVDLDSPVSNFLGTGWTNVPAEKEILITTKNLLTMTSGLDDEPQLVIARNLNYVADAGKRWAYGNVFQKLMDVVTLSSGTAFENYFEINLAQKIGIEGFWSDGIVYRIFHSDTRSMARFGILALQNGTWNDQQIINDDFFRQSVSSSQQINPSYGYMWWLNGKESFMKPDAQTVFDGEIVPNAPSDMYAAMGAHEQRLYIVPGKNMVVLRMGGNTGSEGTSFALSEFDNLLWERLSLIID